MSSAAIVSKVSGAAFVIRGGQEIALSQGMELLISDSIRTGMNGQCELRFADDTEVQLSPMSQVQIQDFAFNPDAPAENSFALHMMEGLVRTVSGEVVKLNPEGFALSTPLGTAGIRGTTVISQIFPTHVVFMVTEMGAGNKVVINSVFGGDLTILMPGQGAELSLTEQQRITLIDSMPENMRDAVREFFENKYDDLRSSHDSILLFGDLEFLAAVGAQNVGRGVGMLSAESEDILIELLQELGVEQPEFFLDAPPGGPNWPDFVAYWGDEKDNLLVPNSSQFGPDFKSINYEIRGYAGNDTIVSFNGTDTIYGGQGSVDQIYKISAEITDDNLIVGGELTLNDPTPLDNDVILLRSLGKSPDNEQGWTSTNDSDYGATLMSGGSVVGSAVNLLNCTGGDNVISLYGSMTGGAIYGKAVNAVDCTLGGSNISLNTVFDTDGVTRIGGELNGGNIYGDAYSMTGGQAGNDYISVNSLIKGDIYGDAFTGSYGAGNNSINVKAMSGGSIYAGDGADIVDIFTYSGGDIYMGQGGSNQQLIVDTQEANLLLKGDTGDTSISITNVLNNSKLTVETLTGALNVTNANHDTVYVTTFAGKDAGTPYKLSYDSTTALNIDTWQSGKAFLNNNSQTLTIGTAKSGQLALGASDAVTITGLAGNFKVDNGSVAQNVTVSTLGSAGTLTTGAGADVITIITASGGTISSGAGSDNISVTNSGGSLTIDGLEDTVSLVGSNMNLTLTNSAGGTLVLDNLTGSNVIAADSNAIMTLDKLDSALNLTGGGKLIVNGWTDDGKLNYSAITSDTNITVTGSSISDVDISGAGGSTGAIINIKANEFKNGEITGSDGVDRIIITRLNSDSGVIDMTGTTIKSGEGPDNISVTGGCSLSGGVIEFGYHGGATYNENVFWVTGSLMGDAKVIGSEGRDSFTISTSMMGTSEIVGGSGYSIMRITHMVGASKISTGEGSDFLTIGDMGEKASIHFDGGSNWLHITNTGISMAGTSSITMDAPDAGLLNEVFIDGSITGSGDGVKIVGSDGNDSIKISGGISGCNITTGAGSTHLEVSSAMSDGSSITTGTGSDTIIVKDMKENASIHFGGGGNELTLQNMTNTAKITMDAPGTGFWNKVHATGNLTGTGTITGSSGRDSIVVDGFLDIDLDCGAGDDIVKAGLGHNFGAANATLNLGTGADYVTITQIYASYADENVTLDLGADNDEDIVDFSGLKSVTSGSVMTIRNFGAEDELRLGADVSLSHTEDVGRHILTMSSGSYVVLYCYNSAGDLTNLP